MATPHLAIVVPTRNSSALLPRLVRSLLDQSFLDFRVIFVDASTIPCEREFLDELVRRDSRFSWVPQDASQTGIYGAMNIGFRLLQPFEWVLFWGSDDWASTPSSLYDAITHPSSQDADLIVCRGRYLRPFSYANSRLVRTTSFRWIFNYRFSLLLGSTPPHQCTLIGPGARRLRDFYDERLCIASDLDYFLSLSRSRLCNVRFNTVSLVDIAVGGVSGVQHGRRLKEVFMAYKSAFGPFCLIPFFARYFQRFLTFCRVP